VSQHCNRGKFAHRIWSCWKW